MLFLDSLVGAADRGDRVLITSGVTLLEVLVVPYRAGDLILAGRYERLLTRGRGIQLIEIDRLQLRAAAQLRAVHRMRTPDALQFAAALWANCSSLITNDRRLPSVAGVEVFELSDHV